MNIRNGLPHQRGRCSHSVVERPSPGANALQAVVTCTLHQPNSAAINVTITAQKRSSDPQLGPTRSMASPPPHGDWTDSGCCNTSQSCRLDGCDRPQQPNSPSDHQGFALIRFSAIAESGICFPPCWALTVLQRPGTIPCSRAARNGTPGSSRGISHRNGLQLRLLLWLRYESQSPQVPCVRRAAGCLVRCRPSDQESQL